MDGQSYEITNTTTGAKGVAWITDSGNWMLEWDGGEDIEVRYMPDDVIVTTIP